jgi:hypothetical protein
VRWTSNAHAPSRRDFTHARAAKCGSTHADASVNRKSPMARGATMRGRVENRGASHSQRVSPASRRSAASAARATRRAAARITAANQGGRWFRATRRPAWARIRTRAGRSGSAIAAGSTRRNAHAGVLGVTSVRVRSSIAAAHRVGEVVARRRTRNAVAATATRRAAAVLPCTAHEVIDAWRATAAVDWNQAATRVATLRVTRTRRDAAQIAERARRCATCDQSTVRRRRIIRGIGKRTIGVHR